MNSEIINNCEVVTIGQNTYVKASLHNINDISLLLEKRPEMILWIESFGLHKFDHHYSGTSLQPLVGLNAKNILIQLNNIVDYSELYSFANLESLDVCDIKCVKINYAFFSKLKKLSLTWCKFSENIDKLTNLENLNIWNYNSSNKNLTYLKGLKSLKSLKIINSNICSIDGISNLANLKTLILGLNKSLRFNDEIMYLQIEELKIELCKNIDVSQIKIFPNVLKLELIGNGNIKSIDSILINFPKLRKLYFSKTKIEQFDESKYKNIEILIR